MASDDLSRRALVRPLLDAIELFARALEARAVTRHALRIVYHGRVIDPLRLSALELARLIRDREVSSEELVRFYLDRIDRLDPQVSSFVTVQHRGARRRARKLDAALAKRRGGEELPLFFGVPTGIKDLVPVRGTPTRFGSRAFRYFVSPMSATVARRLEAGGFVSLGKLATSEFGAMPITEPDIHPPTRNPWNLEHTSGGSSGGSGAAVAGSLVPIAQGSDGAGSIRIPSAFCHLFGFKPSVMRLGNLHGSRNTLGLAVMGPLARSVEDAAAMLDVMAGSPWPGLAEYNGHLAMCRRTVRRMRVRVCLESPVSAVHPAIAEAVRRTARALEELGHHVEDAPPVKGLLEEFLPLWQKPFSQIPVIRESLLQPATRWLRAEGRRIDMAVVRERQRMLGARVAETFGDADLFLSPAVAVLPPRVGAFAHLDGKAMFEAVAPLGAFTAVFNITGQPAAAIPAGVTPDNLPYAVQLAGRVDADGDVLAVARELERAMPWHERRAPGFA